MGPHPLRRLISLTAVAAAAALATAGLTGCHSSPAGPTSAQGAPAAAVVTTPADPATTGGPRSSTTGVPAAPTTTTRPPTTVAPTTTTTVDTSGILKPGNSGPEVMALQQSLTTLGYWLGSPDGQFGGTTQQAVWALQKAAGLPRSGIMDAATVAALSAGTRPSAKSTSGKVIEVDLSRNLLLFVTDGHVDNILNTSTGGGYVYYDQGVRNVALTPKGHFATYRVIEGQHRSSLGLLFRPRFFTGGFAIHGDSYVPARPVSHGCVRVTNAAINWIWATNNDPIGAPVWVY